MHDTKHPEDPQKLNDESSDQGALFRFLATRDALCPACGYNLRMLSKPACPECGLSLKLTVGSDAPYKRAWAIALCINAMVAGAGLFFILITVAEGRPPLHEWAEYFWYYGPMIWIPVPVLLLVLRSWFCRMRAVTQYVLVGLSAIWLLALGAALVLTL